MPLDPSQLPDAIAILKAMVIGLPAFCSRDLVAQYVEIILQYCGKPVLVHASLSAIMHPVAQGSSRTPTRSWGWQQPT
jgi:hypothetical protein